MHLYQRADAEMHVGRLLDSARALLSTSAPKYVLDTCVPRSTSTICFFTLLAILVTIVHLALVSYRGRLKMDHQVTQRTFPFLDLPPELRDMIYENLLEDPHYPAAPPRVSNTSSIFAALINRHTRHQLHLQQKKRTGILLVNKQLYAEYMDVLVKKSTFHLTVSPANYNISTLPTSSLPLDSTDHRDIDGLPSHDSLVSSEWSTTAGAPPVSDPDASKLWTISPFVLHKIRRCSLRLITTSSMLGTPDPRSMPPKSWPLAAKISEELKHVRNVKELSLHVKAIGDPLWNPLWVWYHASMSFCGMGSAPSSSPASPSTAVSSSFSALTSSSKRPSVSHGPILNRITFSLDTWSPGENHLARNEEGKWAWYCPFEHCVGANGTEDMTVREFCARLYTECRVCRPELDSDDEDEEAEGDEDVGDGVVDAGAM